MRPNATELARYDDEFKRRAVKCAIQYKNCSHAARETGAAVRTIWGWWQDELEHKGTYLDDDDYRDINLSQTMTRIENQEASIQGYETANRLILDKIVASVPDISIETPQHVQQMGTAAAIFTDKRRLEAGESTDNIAHRHKHNHEHAVKFYIPATDKRRAAPGNTEIKPGERRVTVVPYDEVDGSEG